MQIYNSLLQVAESRVSSNMPKKYLAMGITKDSTGPGLEVVTDRSAKASLYAISWQFVSNTPNSLKPRLKKEFEAFNEKGGREAAQPLCDEMIQAIDTIIGSAKKHRENLCFKIKAFLAAYLPCLFRSPEKILSSYIAHLETIKKPIINACAQVLPVEEVNQKRKAEFIEKTKKTVEELKNELAEYTDEHRMLEFAKKCSRAADIESKLVSKLANATKDNTPLSYVIFNEGQVFQKLLREISDLKIGDSTREMSADKQKLLDEYKNNGLDDEESIELITKLLVFNSDLETEKLIYTLCFNTKKLKLEDKIEELEKIIKCAEALKPLMLIQKLESLDEIF